VHLDRVGNRAVGHHDGHLPTLSRKSESKNQT
jgi:hypothetical protein